MSSSPNSARGPISNPGPALPPRLWSKPMEFDPSAASRPSSSSLSAPPLNRQMSRQQKLRDELGFDEDTIAEPDMDNDGDGSEDGDEKGPSRRPPGNHYARASNPNARRSSSSSLSSLTDDFESAIKSLRTATEGRRTAESKVRELTDRIDELQRLSTQSKSILVSKFKEQMKTLMIQIEERKSTIQEQDDEILSLKGSVFKYQSGDPSSKLSADESTKKLLALKDQKKMEREMGEIKSKMQQVQADNVGKDAEYKQLTAEMNQLTEKMKTMKEDYDKQITTLKTQLKTALDNNIEENNNNNYNGGDTAGKDSGNGDNVTSSPPPSSTSPSSLTSISEDTTVPSTSPPSSSSSSSSSSSALAIKASTELVRSLESTVESLRSELEKSSNELSIYRTKWSKLTDNEISLPESNDAQLLNFFTTRYEKEKVVEVPVIQQVTTAAVNDDDNNPKILSLTESLHQSKLSLINIQQEMNIYKAQIADIEKERNDLLDKVKLGEDALRKKVIENDLVKEKAKEKLVTASDSIKKLKTEYASLRAQYSVAKGNNNVWREQMGKRKVLLSDMMEKNNENKRNVMEMKEEMVSGFNNVWKGLDTIIFNSVTALIKKGRGEYDNLFLSYKKELALRKSLFNQIQELKGNIRVYCRVRPLSKREVDDGKACIEFVNDEEKNKLIIENVEKKNTNLFEFEKVFRMDSTQEEVFNEVSELVTSVMDGYNVCIFAYGQTGSGKTHTMEGPKENPGVNIRTLTRLFEIQKERMDDMSYEIKISLLEIYNDKIQDLLNPTGKQILKAVAGQYGMEVPDLTMVAVQSQQEVIDTLNIGRKNRKVVATAMNDASSRSHLILSVYVLGRNKISKKEGMGKLHLIDLAGSERISRSGVVGDALKEAQAINSSLSALGNVIAARGAKAAHVPYRDSQLTYLLQDSLEKNSKTLMFVQVSPNATDSSEGICSLRFAERVRKVELGKAGVNRRGSVDGTGGH